MERPENQRGHRSSASIQSRPRPQSRNGQEALFSFHSFSFFSPSISPSVRGVRGVRLPRTVALLPCDRRPPRSCVRPSTDPPRPRLFEHANDAACLTLLGGGENTETATATGQQEADGGKLTNGSPRPNLGILMQLCILLPRRRPKNAASDRALRMVCGPAIPHAAQHDTVQKSAIPFITFYCSAIIELYHLALLTRSSLFTLSKWVGQRGIS